MQLKNLADTLHALWIRHPHSSTLNRASEPAREVFYYAGRKSDLWVEATGPIAATGRTVPPFFRAGPTSKRMRGTDYLYMPRFDAAPPVHALSPEACVTADLQEVSRALSRAVLHSHHSANRDGGTRFCQMLVDDARIWEETSMTAFVVRGTVGVPEGATAELSGAALSFIAAFAAEGTSGGEWTGDDVVGHFDGHQTTLRYTLHRAADGSTLTLTVRAVPVSSDGVQVREALGEVLTRTKAGFSAPASSLFRKNWKDDKNERRFAVTGAGARIEVAEGTGTRPTNVRAENVWGAASIAFAPHYAYTALHRLGDLPVTVRLADDRDPIIFGVGEREESFVLLLPCVPFDF